MPSGTLEVTLVSGHGLKSGDFFSKTDAYCILGCGNQTLKSNVATNQGSKPSWNQIFVFSLNDDVDDLVLKVMDKDFATADDELGVVTVPLADVFQAGETAVASYKVVQKNGHYKGEIRLSLSFRRQDTEESAHGGHRHRHKAQTSEGLYGAGSQGGWNQGS